MKLMYLVAIHVPIYVEGGKQYVATDWHRSLMLLRDSVRPYFGQLTVLARYPYLWGTVPNSYSSPRRKMMASI